MAMPTIADIAAKAGVNRSTVSRNLNNNRDFALSVVKVDESSGAEDLVKTLLAAGHRRTAYFAERGRRDSPQCRALREAAKKHGLIFFEDDQFVYERKTNGYLTDRSEASRAARTLSDGLRSYSVMICASDLVALGVADALFGGDFDAAEISLIGYDNIEENPNYRDTTPVLATIDPRKDDVGRRAGELILRNLGRKKSGGETIKISTKFIHRRSLMPINGKHQF